MAGRCCDNCVYSVCDPELVQRLLWLGEPIVPRCANHPFWPGQLHDVPGVPCRNYRRKPALPTGDVRMIPLGDGFYAYVDAADYEWLSQWHWYVHDGYGVRIEKRKWIYMHRQIMRAPKDKLVDHMDGNKANNCRSNLRICNPQENRRNQRKHSDGLSRFKGVSYDKRYDTWRGRCYCGGRYHWLGHFDDEVDAARAYDRAAVQYFGEFARLNFPEEWPPERRAQLHAQRDAVKTEGKKAKTRRGESRLARRSAAPQRTERRKAKSRRTPQPPVGANHHSPG